MVFLVFLVLPDAVANRELLENLAEEVWREPKDLGARVEALVDLESLDLLENGERLVEQEVLVDLALLVQGDHLDLADTTVQKEGQEAREMQERMELLGVMEPKENRGLKENPGSLAVQVAGETQDPVESQGSQGPKEHWVLTERMEEAEYPEYLVPRELQEQWVSMVPKE